MIQKLIHKIETKRNKRSLFFRLLILTKDFFWEIASEITTYIIQRNYPKKIMQQVKKENENFSGISFCTTCMNRGHHLKKTLPKNLRDNREYPNLEFIIIDYNSQDNVSEWILEKFKKEIKTGRIKIFQTKTPRNFHMSHAKNLAHLNATKEIVCNLDADNFTGKDFAFYINHQFKKDKNIILANKKDIPKKSTLKDRLIKVKEIGSGGRIAITKENFIKLGGYDESFTGWGCEDNDFFTRALRLKLKEKIICFYFLRCLRHFGKPRRSINRKFFRKNNKLKIIKVKNKIKINNLKRLP